MVTINNASHNAIRLVQIDEALQLLQTTHRIAFIDVRDRKSYVDEHPIFAVNAPIDSIEFQIKQLFGDETGIALIIGDNPTLTRWAAAVIADITLFDTSSHRRRIPCMEESSPPNLGRRIYAIKSIW